MPNKLKSCIVLRIKFL